MIVFMVSPGVNAGIQAIIFATTPPERALSDGTLYSTAAVPQSSCLMIVSTRFFIMPGKVFVFGSVLLYFNSLTIAALRHTLKLCAMH